MSVSLQCYHYPLFEMLSWGCFYTKQSVPSPSHNLLVETNQIIMFVSKTCHPYQLLIQLYALATFTCPIKCSFLFKLNGDTGDTGDKLDETPTYFLDHEPLGLLLLS